MEFDKTDLYFDLKNSDTIQSKCLESDSYAQNIYAALCNMQWQKAEVFTILKDETWSCTWRYAAQIASELRGGDNYMDYYCSGMLDEAEDLGYVPESDVTDEIRNDLAQLEWHPVPYPSDDFI